MARLLPENIPLTLITGIFPSATFTGKILLFYQNPVIQWKYGIRINYTVFLTAFIFSDVSYYKQAE